MHIRSRSTRLRIRPCEGHWQGQAGMVRSRAYEHVPLPLLAPMLSSAAMRAICDDVACLQNMLDFEAGLARAEAAIGVIPASAAGPIAAACRAESFDLAALAEAATRSGNLAIPLVKALTAHVAKTDAGCRALCPLGCDQPGRHRHRRHARPARRHRCAARRHRPRRRGFCGTGATRIAIRLSWPAPGCSTRCRCRSG